MGEYIRPARFTSGCVKESQASWPEPKSEEDRA